MTDIGHNSNSMNSEEVRGIMSQAETIMDEIDAAKVALDDIWTVAKSKGLDVPALRLALKVKMMDSKKREAREARHERARAYLHASSPQLNLF